ncbi:MAG: NAD(P)-binding protein, partial [Thermoleophilia bacterium]|nr:NAD(P)-binding protein [Thermoleophilia bacterium]
MVEGDAGKQVSAPVIVLGGGPAGLTAADAVCRQGLSCIVFEKETQVGGLARTANYRGYLFDIGGHRFFTKVRLIQQLWEETL